MNLNRRNLFIGLSALFGAAVLPNVNSANALGNKTTTVIPTVVSEYEKVKQQVIDASYRFVTDHKYEINDEITRNLCVKTIDPILHLAKNDNIIYEYNIRCNEINNTPSIIDNNELVFDVYIKPTRSTPYTHLSFICCNTTYKFD